MHPFHRLSEKEACRGSQGSTAQRSLCKPLLSAASWIRSCEDRKNSEATHQVRKLHAANVKTTCRKSLHLAGTLQLGKCRENGQNTKPRRNRQKYHRRAPRRQNPGTKDTRRAGRRRSQPQEQRDPARARSRTPTGKAGETPRGTHEEQKAEEEQHGDLHHRDDAHEESLNGRTGPQDEEQRAENREDVNIRNPTAPRKNNCASHRRTNVVQPLGATAQQWCSQPLPAPTVRGLPPS